MLVFHGLLPKDAESWKQQESITVVRSDLIWQQSETVEKLGIKQMCIRDRYAVLKEMKKTKGRVRLETLVKSGRPL